MGSANYEENGYNLNFNLLTISSKSHVPYLGGYRPLRESNHIRLIYLILIRLLLLDYSPWGATLNIEFSVNQFYVSC